MASLAAFRTRVATRVAGCADPVIDQAVLDTCIDFCERTRLVRRMLDTFTTVSGKAEYDLDAGVVMVMRMWCDDLEIKPAADDEADDPFVFVNAIPGQTKSLSTPRFFSQPEPGILRLYPTPDKAYTINTRVAYKPSRSATQVEDQLFEDYATAIADGALARILMMPEQPFSNPSMAVVHGTAYGIAANAALLESVAGRSRGELRIRPVRI